MRWQEFENLTTLSIAFGNFVYRRLFNIVLLRYLFGVQLVDYVFMEELDALTRNESLPELTLAIVFEPINFVSRLQRGGLSFLFTDEFSSDDLFR